MSPDYEDKRRCLVLLWTFEAEKTIDGEPTGRPIRKTIWIEENKARATARKARVVLAGTACLLTCLLVWAWNHRAPTAIPVQGTLVQQQSIYRRVTIPGMVETAQSAAIAPRSHATVTAVYVRVGDLVREGDTLCTLQPNDGLGVDHLSLLSLWSTAMQFGGETVTVSPNLNALLAPCTGTVLALPETGQVVYQAMPCAAVANLSYLQIRAQVPAPSAADIQTGQTAQITAAEIEGVTFTGMVTSVAPVSSGEPDPANPTNSIDPPDRADSPDTPPDVPDATVFGSGAGSDSGSGAKTAKPEGATLLEVILPLRGKVDGLRPGYHVTATIATVHHPEAVVIPTAAIWRQNGQPMVFVIQGGRAQARPIVCGYSLGDTCEVTAGLSVGESVVVQPPAALQAGDAVTCIGEP